MPVNFTAGLFMTALSPTPSNPLDLGLTSSGDLNNDGNSDLLVLGASYPYRGAPVAQPSLLLLGTGDGNFSVASQAVLPFASLTTVHPREVVFADFNGDGFKDVFVADHGYDTMPFPGAQNKLFLSNGNGSWRDASSSLPQISDFSHGASAADVNGDGAIDIVVGNIPRPNPVDPYILLNNGAGGFSRAEGLLPTGPGGALNADIRRMTSELLVDLDGDGRAELVAGAGFSTSARPVSMQILWNTNGSFAQAPATELPPPAFFGREQSVYDIQALDVNFDGLQDLLVAYQGAGSLGGWELQVLVNKGNRTFADETTTWLPSPALRNGGTPSQAVPESQYWVQFLNLADVNGDGRLDFTLDARGITAAPATLPVAYIHQADGTFAAATVAEIGGANGHWLFDYTTQYVTWAGGGGIAHVSREGASVSVQTLPVAFETILPAYSGGTTPLNLVGGAAADALTGGRYNDSLTGAGGNDTLDGGAGVDTAVYSGKRADYTVTRGDNGWTISSTAEGTDSLANVERLAFSDAKLAIDTAGNGGMAYRLYQAAFNRTPDHSGLGYQMQALDNGLSLSQVAANFIASPEFQQTYGALNNTQFVTQLYQNVLHRAPDEGGLAYHVGNLAGGMARANVLMGFSESPENQAALIGAIGNGMLYTV